MVWLQCYTNPLLWNKDSVIAVKRVAERLTDPRHATNKSRVCSFVLWLSVFWLFFIVIGMERGCSLHQNIKESSLSFVRYARLEVLFFYVFFLFVSVEMLRIGL